MSVYQIDKNIKIIFVFQQIVFYQYIKVGDGTLPLVYIRTVIVIYQLDELQQVI